MEDNDSKQLIQLIADKIRLEGEVYTLKGNAFKFSLVHALAVKDIERLNHVIDILLDEWDSDEEAEFRAKHSLPARKE